MSNIIKQFQFVQTGINDFNVILVLKDEYRNWSSSIEKTFIENINDQELKNVKWTFKYVDRILPDSITGKVQLFKRII